MADSTGERPSIALASFLMSRPCENTSTTSRFSAGTFHPESAAAFSLSRSMKRYDAGSVDSNMKRSWSDELAGPSFLNLSCPRSSAIGSYASSFVHVTGPIP